MLNRVRSSKHTDEVSKSAPSSKTSTKRPSSRNKKPLQGVPISLPVSSTHSSLIDASPSTQTPSARRQKKRGTKQDTDAVTKQEDESQSKPVKTEKQSPPPVSHSDSNDGESPRMDDDANDPFGSGL